MRIAVVTAIPTPYRDPFWNVVAEQPGVELSVVYCAAGKADRPWSGDWEKHYQSEVLPGHNLLSWKGGDASIYHNPIVVKRLEEGNFDAVLIGGYNHVTMLLAVRFCIRARIPYFLMCESHLQKSRSWLRTAIKDRLVRWVVGNMAGGFPTGTLAEQYLQHYGADPETLTHIPNAPDVEIIRQQAQELRKNRAQLRREHGLSERKTMLFAGRLIPKKGAHLIIEAMAKTGRDDVADLVIIGDGPERQSLMDLVKSHGLEKRVRFTGFAEPGDMVSWYVAADVFVLPSAETWGVVVAEALAAGTPVIVSDQVGCHPDVVGQRQVGEVISREDTAAWATAISGDILASGTVDAAWRGVFERMRFTSVAERMLKNVRSAQVNLDTRQVQASQ